MKAILLLGLALVLTGCVSYTPEMGQRERIIARYEQTHAMPEDSWGGRNSKRFKRICVDVITFGLMEIWYGRARSSYRNVMADEHGWNAFADSVKGKPYGDVLARYGSPTKTQDLGDGRRMMIYEHRSMTGEVALSGGFLGTMSSFGNMGALGSIVGGTGSFSSSENVRQSWLVVDANNIVVDVARNWWNLGLAKYP